MGHEPIGFDTGRPLACGSTRLNAFDERDRWTSPVPTHRTPIGGLITPVRDLTTPPENGASRAVTYPVMRTVDVARVARTRIRHVP